MQSGPLNLNSFLKNQEGKTTPKAGKSLDTRGLHITNYRIPGGERSCSRCCIREALAASWVWVEAGELLPKRHQTYSPFFRLWTGEGPWFPNIYWIFIVLLYLFRGVASLT